jgi:hypothetical protein
MEGSTIKGFVDGIEVVSATDTDITAVGRVGLRMQAGTSSFAPIADFAATTLHLAPPPPPPWTDPPTDLTATASSSTSASLAWTDHSDEEAFEIERCEGTGCSAFSYVGQVGADVTNYSDSGLTAGTEYCYQVRGVVGGAPTGYSNTDCATTATSGSRFVEDGFEDSPGTLLQAHTGAIGATWTLHPMSSGNAQFSSTGSEVESPTRSVYMASGFPRSTTRSSRVGWMRPRTRCTCSGSCTWA